jgi:hypothetical protein
MTDYRYIDGDYLRINLGDSEPDNISDVVEIIRTLPNVIDAFYAWESDRFLLNIVVDEGQAEYASINYPIKVEN